MTIPVEKLDIESVRFNAKPRISSSIQTVAFSTTLETLRRQSQLHQRSIPKKTPIPASQIRHRKTTHCTKVSTAGSVASGVIVVVPPPTQKVGKLVRRTGYMKDPAYVPVVLLTTISIIVVRVTYSWQASGLNIYRSAQ